MSRGQYKYLVKFVKIDFEKDEYGSMKKVDGETFSIKAKLISNKKDRDNQQGDMTYLYDKTIQIDNFKSVSGYDEFIFCCKRYRIVGIETDENYNTITINGEEINE